MSEVTRELEVTFTEREDAPPRPGVYATFDAIAVPYGVPSQPISDRDGIGYREQFAPGAFDINDVIGKPLTWRHNEPIGVITAARNTPDGLDVTADVSDTSLGRDAAALMRSKAVKGVSVGFEAKSSSWTRTRSAVTRITAAFGHLAVTHQPAYLNASITAIREENQMSEITEVEGVVVPAIDLSGFATREDVASIQRQIATISAPIHTTDRPVDPEAWLREYGVNRFQKRALDDLILDASGTDIPVVPTEVSARVAFGRPTVTAIGVSALGATGNDAVWLVEGVQPGMAKRSGAEKTAVASTNPTYVKVTSPVETFAGALDVSLEWIARSAAADYPYLIGQMAEQYARKVNLDVAAKITAAAANTIILPDTGLTAEVLGQKLAFAAGKIAVGTGRPPSLVVLTAEKFFQVATVAGFGFPIAGGNVGNANLAGMSYTAFGVRFVCDPSLDGNLAATQHGYMLDPMSVGIKENAGAPLTIEANNVELLGRDVALYGFVASAVLNAAGIVSVTDA